jgi:hypothetical protein
MKKSIGLLVAGVVALLVLAKTTNVSSYVGTLWSQATTAAKQQVPTKFEIDRIRHDIATLDQELDAMIRPIAEHKVAVDKLRKQVADDEIKLGEQRKVLLDAIDAVKSCKKGDKLCYGGRQYTATDVKAKIGIDSEAFKRFEANVNAEKKLLAAKEATLTAAQDQLQTYLSKKREFEVQLAQLEADYEINQVAAIGSEIKIDNTRLASIGQSLADLKDTIDRERTALELRKGIEAARNIPLDQPQQTVGVDLDAIQAHLQGTTQPATQKTGTTVSTK